MPDRGQLSTLLALYTPYVTGGPNFAPANFKRGENRMLAKAIVALGLMTESEVADEFMRRDREYEAASLARLAEINARDKAET